MTPATMTDKQITAEREKIEGDSNQDTTSDSSPGSSADGAVAAPEEQVTPSAKEMVSPQKVDKTPAIEVHDLTVAYRSKPVLWGIDLEITPGQIVGIIGPNGAGKSTLIKAMLGMVPPVGGWVRFFNRPYTEVRDRIGYVPQRSAVDWDFPVTVLDVVLMGRYGKLGLFRRIKKADREAAYDALEKMGMAAFANRQISQLSGGQQQRTFLARALVQESDIYLMDEPFVGVDAATEEAIITLLRELSGRGSTIVVVNHDLHTARTYFDSLLLLNMRVVAYGPTAEVFTPKLLQDTYGGRLTIMSDVAQDVFIQQG